MQNTMVTRFHSTTLHLFLIVLVHYFSVLVLFVCLLLFGAMGFLPEIKRDDDDIYYIA